MMLSMGETHSPSNPIKENNDVKYEKLKEHSRCLSY